MNYIFFKGLFRGNQEKYYIIGDGFILVYSIASKETIKYLTNIKNDIMFAKKSFVRLVIIRNLF